MAIEFAPGERHAPVRPTKHRLGGLGSAGAGISVAGSFEGAPPSFTAVIAVHEVVPEPLQEITGPDDLVTVLRRFDRGGRGSRPEPLLSPPFDTGQTAAIEARVVPVGAL